MPRSRSRRRVVALACLLAVAAAAGGVVALSGGSGARCDGIDFERFRASEPGGPSSPRIALADTMVRCGVLGGKGRAEVRRLLGAPPPGGLRDEWLYELGQRGPADLDSSQLLVIFRGDRVIEARIVET